MREYSKEELQLVVEKSKSYYQVLKHFERNASKNSYEVLRKKLSEFNITTNHFLSRSELTKLAYDEGKMIKRQYDEMFCEKSLISRHTVKDRILKENLIEYICCFCRQGSEWMGKKISLILDHINGVNNDNRLCNLRFLCPNCNATLDTHCKGSKGLVKKKKIDLRKKRKIRLETRKVERPEFETLLKDIEELGYCGTGRKYGVSDNAIRKWVKNYAAVTSPEYESGNCNRS